VVQIHSQAMKQLGNNQSLITKIYNFVQYMDKSLDFIISKIKVKKAIVIGYFIYQEEKRIGKPFNSF